MAPLPVNSTNRLWVRKVGVTGTHEIMFRGQPGSDQVDLAGVASDFLNATKGLVYEGDIWTSARYSASGSDLSFPVGWTPIAGANGSAYDGRNQPFFVDWVGRGPDGRRVRWSIQGAVPFQDSNYRAVQGENAGVDAGIASLNSAVSILATIGGTPPFVYGYADVGYNAYQQRKRRRS
jgi:hypothetical protein